MFLAQAWRFLSYLGKLRRERRSAESFSSTRFCLQKQNIPSKLYLWVHVDHCTRMEHLWPTPSFDPYRDDGVLWDWFTTAAATSLVQAEMQKSLWTISLAHVKQSAAIHCNSFCTARYTQAVGGLCNCSFQRHQCLVIFKVQRHISYTWILLHIRTLYLYFLHLFSFAEIPHNH